jgi:hypothetical protein
MGLKHLHHIVHTIALVEILRAGPVAEIDVDHYWNFLDNTYHDDVWDMGRSYSASCTDIP